MHSSPQPAQSVPTPPTKAAVPALFTLTTGFASGGGGEEATHRFIIAYLNSRAAANTQIKLFTGRNSSSGRSLVGQLL